MCTYCKSLTQAFSIVLQFYFNQISPFLLCQACPFQVDVHCEGTHPSIQPLSMNSGPKRLNQALQKSITARAGAKALRGQDNIFIYTYRGEHRISTLIANKVDDRLCKEIIICGGIVRPTLAVKHII